MDRFAVLVPWVRTEYGNALLMEVRSEKVKQPGEICFPGGRAEPGEYPSETAVRECCEELGIAPDKIKVTGELPALHMSDGRVVYPVEAALEIDDIGELRLSEYEVAEVFLLPRNWLEENKPVHFDLSATPFELLPDKLQGYLSYYTNFRRRGQTDYLEYEGHGIWGLTARIIKCVMGDGSQ